MSIKCARCGRDTPEWELDENIAVLRHCELVNEKKEGDMIYMVLFND